jgi:hypothetical protein
MATIKRNLDQIGSIAHEWLGFLLESARYGLGFNGSYSL